jgi:hypothetical protein
MVRMHNGRGLGNIRFLLGVFEDLFLSHVNDSVVALIHVLHICSCDLLSKLCVVLDSANVCLISG